MAAGQVVLDGFGRVLPSATDSPVRVTLGEADWTLAIGTLPRVAAYRDLTTIAVQQGTVLLVLGSGPSADRLLLSRFGSAQGQLLRELRERRLRQQLADGLVAAPADETELVEYRSGEQHGVAMIAYHPWGVILAPLDERLAWIRIRRGAIAEVTVDEAAGSLAVSIGGAAPEITLIGLGERVRLHGDRVTALARAAREDAGRLIGGLIPDADYAVRREAAEVLVDGRPARPADLPTAWDAIEAGVLAEPTFAASYGALRTRSGPGPERSIAIAPTVPVTGEARTWFFVPLPGNLVAMELVSSGAHATYCFRVQPRAEFAGGVAPAEAVAAAVRDVSEALVDARFLREPMALPDDVLRQPANLRYRLALRALPSLAAARERFVGRIVHRDEASWAAALDDLIAWHGASRDDTAIWPGRATQESMVGEAAQQDGSSPALTGTPPPEPAGGS
jgi:hypothetical protein